MAESFVRSAIAGKKVVVFSKTTCPYCTKAKSALASVGLAAGHPDLHIIELDARSDGAAVQAALGFTGATTVPRVFVGGEFIGGGDDTARLARSGELKTKLGAAGVAL